MWTRKGSVGEVVLGMCYCWVYLYKHNSTQLIPPHRPFMRKSFLLTHVFFVLLLPLFHALLHYCRRRRTMREPERGRLSGYPSGRVLGEGRSVGR